jgi:hypothetical protein
LIARGRGHQRVGVETPDRAGCLPGTHSLFYLFSSLLSCGSTAATCSRPYTRKRASSWKN